MKKKLFPLCALLVLLLIAEINAAFASQFGAESVDGQ